MSQNDDLGKREMMGMARDMQNGQLDEQQIDKVWDQIPEETKRQAFTNALEQFVLPHADDVKDRAESDVGNKQIRQKYSALDDERQQEIFDQAIGTIIGTLFEVRESPREGLMRLKGLLRDPYTLEGLLLIFENEDHIDPEYSAEMKEFAAWYVTAAGVALTPEMYDEQTCENVYDTFDLLDGER